MEAWVRWIADRKSTAQNLSVVRPVLLVLSVVEPCLTVLKVLHHVEPGLPVLQVVNNIEPCLPIVLHVHQLVRLLLWQRTCCFSRLAAFLVSPNMFVQMIRSGESFAALRTHKSLLASVCPQMSLQLIRPGERLAAKHPATGERSLTSVPPEVSLQVAGLAIHLAAAWHMAHMLSLPNLSMTFHTVGCTVLTVGALASPATSGCHTLRVLEQGCCNLGRVSC